MFYRHAAFAAGARATLPVLLGIVPFGVIAGVAMVASGIPPLVAMLMSILVFAGASMVASAQLLASSAPAALIVFSHLIHQPALHDVQCIAAPALRWAPEVLVQNEQLPAGVVAVVVAWRWRMTFATIIAGLLALHFFAWIK